MKELSASEYVFLKWLQDTHPALYQAAEDRQRSLSGFMDSLTSVFENVSKAAPALLEQYVKGKQDLAILKANLARAKQGEVPITATGQPYDPASGNFLTRPTAGIPTWVLLALSVGAVYLFTRK